MQFVNECFVKVKKDCYKFISSQETKKDKFKNKDKMIKSFLIPASYWIAKKANEKKPLMIGLAGGQGSGKTTISSILTLILKKYFKLNVFKISIDDFYKTNVDGFYAIGDVVHGPALAHVASAEGITCIEKIKGMSVNPLDYGNIPGCTYCKPEIASVGLQKNKQ